MTLSRLNIALPVAPGTAATGANPAECHSSGSRPFRAEGGHLSDRELTPGFGSLMAFQATMRISSLPVGSGILIGDGRLHYATEDILEAFYRYQIIRPLSLTANYQLFLHPAYNQDRGPVSVFAVRLHLQL